MQEEFWQLNLPMRVKCYTIILQGSYSIQQIGGFCIEEMNSIYCSYLNKFPVNNFVGLHVYDSVTAKLAAMPRGVNATITCKTQPTTSLLCCLYNFPLLLLPQVVDTWLDWCLPVVQKGAVADGGNIQTLQHPQRLDVAQPTGQDCSRQQKIASWCFVHLRLAGPCRGVLTADAVLLYTHERPLCVFHVCYTWLATDRTHVEQW